jgi:signal transduction histidine kinase
MHLSSVGSLYPLGVSAAAIMTGVILIADFTRVSFMNKDLTLSLRQTNVELADALLRAQEAVRLKSEFVANVSHELRTPLNSILNIPEGLVEQFADVRLAHCERCGRVFKLEEDERLKDDARCPGCEGVGSLRPEEAVHFQGDGHSARQALRQVHQAGNNLLALIDEVLDFSKLEGGPPELKQTWTEAAAVFGDVWETLKPLAQRRNIEAGLLVPEGAPRIWVDVAKVVRALVNVVGNAIKFSPDGSEIQLGCEWTDHVYRLWVADKGVGIAPEHHQTIFESFRQVDGSNTRRYGGTGLGLAIARKLIELQGGRIWVKSELGAGSTFYLELPRGVALAAEPTTEDKAPIEAPRAQAS